MDVVAVVNLAEVIEAVALLGVWQSIAASIVVDCDEALLNVDVGGAVLTHSTKLHKVAVCRTM